MEVLIRDGAHIIADRKAKGLDKHDEMHHGVYVVMNLPGLPHQRRVDEILHWFRERGVFRVPGVNVGEDQNFRGPDVAASFSEPVGDVWFDHETAPEIVVEVISPSNSPGEMAKRREHFGEHGVKVYAEVDRSGAVSVEVFGVLTNDQRSIIAELGRAVFN